MTTGYGGRKTGFDVLSAPVPQTTDKTADNTHEPDKNAYAPGPHRSATAMAAAGGQVRTGYQRQAGSEQAVREDYLRHTGHRLDLNDPRRFTEKIQWYKLRYRNPLMPVLADQGRRQGVPGRARLRASAQRNHRRL